jgi:hypothetical protein
MSQQNAIAVAIPEAELSEIRGAIDTLRAKLAPRLVSLSPQDRQELPKMGDKTVAFVQKAMEYGSRNKELVPPYLDLAALQLDFEAVRTLRELSQELGPLAASLEDSMVLSGSEAYQGALLFYGAVKAAAKAKAPRAEVIYEDLASRFPGAQSKKRV